ncbi:hypothetical protein [Sodalis endosymbiont of Henestaris halophilus]|uniref:hypothetical protein n=1 Tax=Sodalis endosymbiont of Henestaris halophilus TaxID=1929246 RepID=UPI000BE3E708|nr:hypothetical protein [Sodalis endosymbiont of Henestaris halophilus]
MFLNIVISTSLRLTLLGEHDNQVEISSIKNLEAWSSLKILIGHVPKQWEENAKVIMSVSKIGSLFFINSMILGEN